MKKRLIKCFKQVFPEVPNSQIGSIKDQSVHEWTSLTVIQLIMAVEREFGIEIDLERLEHLTSFDAFLGEVEKASSAE